MTMKRRVIYLSDGEWERLRHRAAELDMTISAYVRSKALFANTEPGVAYEVRPPQERFNSQPFTGPILKIRK